MALEDGGRITTVSLSSSRLDFWQAMLLVRALSALLAWVFLCLERGPANFALPPLPPNSDTHGQLMAAGPR